jgi:hypothetical protein
MSENFLIPSERIINKIYIIRNRKVMLDRDLAELYGVKTMVLNQAVKRNMKRFPEDFMFQLTKKEMENWISQIVISKSERMGLRKLPYVFTEQGVAMLSSVLNSNRAIQVNIQIIRTFTRIRELLVTNEALHHKIMEMEKKYDGNIQKIFQILGELLEDDKRPRRKIGF